MTSADEQFRLGVNYWPKAKAMYWWKHFDGHEVDEEFAHIAEWGLSHVRFFLLWEDFQPEPHSVSTSALRNLETVMDTAHRHGLATTPTLLVGNMSGVMWIPPWAFTDLPEPDAALQFSAGQYVSKQVRQLFSDPGMLRAETLLAREVARAIGHHPALHSWDLANEIDGVMAPLDPDAGWLWTATVSTGLRERSSAPVTYGAHRPSLVSRGLTIPAIAPPLDYLCMHGYPIYSTIARGPLDAEFVAFVTTLTARLGGKACLMQEFGVPTTSPGSPSRTFEDWFTGRKRQQYLASEEEAGEYYRQVLDRLWETGALGAVCWDYADYVPDLWDRPPLDLAIRERTFGIFRSDGSPKPPAEVMRTFAADLRSGDLQRRLGPLGSKAVDLPVDPEEYYRDPAAEYPRLYDRYLRLVTESQM